MSAWVRRCLTVACLLAAWLVVHPAYASAPLCDSRAASTVAPLPVLDPPNASLDVSVDLGEYDGCDGWDGRDSSYQRGDSPSPKLSALHVDVLPTCGLVGLPSAALVGRSGHVVNGGPLTGVSSGLERPPRSI